MATPTVPTTTGPGASLRRVLGIRPAVAGALFLVAFVPFYTWVSWRIGYNSDNASGLLIAKDIGEGNLLGMDWMFSTQSYLFSDNFPTAVVIAAFGYSPILIHVMPAFYFAATALFAILLVARARPENILLLAPFVLIPTAFTTLMANQLALHGGAYVLASASIYLAGYVSDRRLVPALAVAAIAWGIVANSDELFLVIFMLPAILAAVLHVVVAPGRRSVALLAVTLGGLVAYGLAGVIVDHLFLYETPGVGHKGLADFATIRGNVQLLVDGLASYFAIGFSGDLLTQALSALRLLFLLALLAGFVFTIIFTTAWRKSYADTVLFFSTGATVCAFVLSTMPVDLMSSRYLFFAILAAIILVARNVALGRLAKPAGGLLVILALANLQSVLLATSSQTRYADLARYLRDNGLTRGYSGFWQSHVTTVAGDVHVAPVWALSTVRPFYWLSKTTWYGPGRTFFMTPDPREKAVALAQFGPPRRELRHGDMDILVWDEIPMPMMGFIALTGDVGAARLGPHRRTPDGFGTARERGTFLEEVAPSLPKGRYRLVLDGVKRAGQAEIAIDTGSGGLAIRQPIAMGDGRLAAFEFALTQMTRDLRIRIRVRKADDLVIRSYALYRIGD